MECLAQLHPRAGGSLRSEPIGLQNKPQGFVSGGGAWLLGGAAFCPQKAKLLSEFADKCNGASGVETESLSLSLHPCGLCDLGST